ncbi:MAG: Elongation factor P--(R)-beta-lysine ligase [Chlamydiae bacterium]|nr:Elongation factor P--(R)-beta-lysine ligase [Chlamydiota bacterium]
MKRAQMLAAVRTFFDDRDVIEVDTDILSPAAPIDAHIDVMEVDMGDGKIGYLHTSPEYALKKLLAAGSGDIYQLSHVFRAGEESPLHFPEFTMIEWYRLNLDYTAFIEETLDLIRLFLPDLPAETLSYRQALRTYAAIDIAETKNLYECVLNHQIDVSEDAKNWDRDTLLTLLFSHLIEPQLGRERLTVITDYPSSQAALAKTAHIDGLEVARRFEVYYYGVELANGYDELTDASEQRERLLEENEERITLGKKSLPIDEEFIAALEKGLPDCRGVAVGFDRLLMLHLGNKKLGIYA